MSSTPKSFSRPAAVGPEELRVVLGSLPRGAEGRAQLKDWLQSFFVVDQPQTHERDWRRGNIEQLLCAVFLHIPLGTPALDPTIQHSLTSMVFDLEARRGRRFASGHNIQARLIEPRIARARLGLPKRTPVVGLAAKDGRLPLTSTPLPSISLASVELVGRSLSRSSGMGWGCVTGPKLVRTRGRNVDCPGLDEGGRWNAGVANLV